MLQVLASLMLRLLIDTRLSLFTELPPVHDVPHDGTGLTPT